MTGFTVGDRVFGVYGMRLVDGVVIDFTMGGMVKVRRDGARQSEHLYPHNLYPTRAEAVAAGLASATQAHKHAAETLRAWKKIADLTDTGTNVVP